LLDASVAEPVDSGLACEVGVAELHAGQADPVDREGSQPFNAAARKPRPLAGLICAWTIVIFLAPLAATVTQPWSAITVTSGTQFLRCM
jgi:hypothetical protein